MEELTLNIKRHNSSVPPLSPVFIWHPVYKYNSLQIQVMCSFVTRYKTPARSYEKKSCKGKVGMRIYLRLDFCLFSASSSLPGERNYHVHSSRDTVACEAGAPFAPSRNIWLVLRAINYATEMKETFYLYYT